jgi:HEAT repeat protein
MGKRGRVLIAIAAVAILAVLAWTVLYSPAPEPVCRGKPLSYWLQGFIPGSPNQPTYTDATVAVDAIGTNAIPVLVRMLRAHDSPLKTKFFFWAAHVRFLKLSYTPSFLINIQAQEAFRFLGPSAATAVPELIGILDQQISPHSEVSTALALANIGPEAKAAVPSLLSMATSTNEFVRGHALYALGRIHAEPGMVVPILVKALHDPFAMNRGTAAGALGRFGGNARPALPALLAMFHDPNVNSNSAYVHAYSFNADVLTQVEYALRQIDPETYAPVVTNSVQTPIPYR